MHLKNQIVPVAHPDRTTYINWQACLYKPSHPLRTNHWFEIEANCNYVEQMMILAAVTVCGIPVADWQRVFACFISYKDYLRSSASRADAILSLYTGALLKEPALPLVHYYPSSRPEWLITLYNYPQSQYLQDLTCCWDEIDEEVYGVPWDAATWAGHTWHSTILPCTLQAAYKEQVQCI